MPTRNHVGHDAKPVTSDPALQADREEAVVVPHEHTNPDGWPRREVTHRLKGEVGLGSLIRLALGRDLGIDIVQEVGGHLEGTVATGVGRLVPGLESARVRPPVAHCLTWDRDHRVDQNQLADGHPLADERGGEPSERPCDEYDVRA